MKSKIEEILYKHSERVGLYEGGVITCVDENEFEEIAQEIVKLFAIPDVSQQSELLKAFYAYVDDKWALGMLTDKVDEVIEGFEKSL